LALERYHARRDFSRTPEPQGEVAESGEHRYVIQMHAARRLHYDLRLEHGGVLRSWALPKGPSPDPRQRRLAVETEDHPLEYAAFEGVIPPGAYGAGTMMVWDSGVWEPLSDPTEGLQRGHLKFRLYGYRLGGAWTLVRRGGSADAAHWLLIKEDDEFAREDGQVTTGRVPCSVASGRSPDQIRLAENPRAGIGTASDPVIPGITLATLAAEAPAGADWLHELKHDGYRLLCLLKEGNARLFTRAGKDWTGRFPTVAEAAARLRTRDALLDGEVVALRADGASDFQTLQNALRGGHPERVIYYVFDLLRQEGRDLATAPLRARKRALAELLASSPGQRTVRYSDHVEGQGPAFFRQVCDRGLEGILSKRADSPYPGRRTEDWLKVKCGRRQEFVVGGFTEPAGSRRRFGSLLLGVFDDSRLRYAGKVGTGFSGGQLDELSARLEPLRRDDPAFVPAPPGRLAGRRVTWVEPRLVVEVRFAEWTRDGRLRLPAFLGVRDDKPAAEVTPESAVTHSAATPPEHDMADVRLTHPDRVLYPEQGITKARLAAYYAQHARWIMPHVRDRPLSLVRCPRGRRARCFYQKHLDDEAPEGIEAVPIVEQNGERPNYGVVRDEAGLLSLVQMGVLEIHPWGSRVDRLEQPDRLIVDLDPGEGVEWSRVIEAGHTVRALLDGVGLTGFAKLTGGKGLHVVAPLQRRQSWDELHEFAASLARHLERSAPERFTASMSRSRRSGRIFVDYLRNGRGATAVAAYSTRAKAGAPIATPVGWEELDAIERSNAFTLHTLPERLAGLRDDPWAGFFDLRQSVGAEQRRRLAALQG
jgi:bifunctional non-homologous end joining protein LigD